MEGIGDPSRGTGVGERTEEEEGHPCGDAKGRTKALDLRGGTNKGLSGRPLEPSGLWKPSVGYQSKRERDALWRTKGLSGRPLKPSDL